MRDKDCEFRHQLLLTLIITGKHVTHGFLEGPISNDIHNARYPTRLSNLVSYILFELFNINKTVIVCSSNRDLAQILRQ